MKLTVYMLRRFFPIFVGALMFFVLVLCLTDLFMNLWNYISKNVPFVQVATILLYYVPKSIWYAVPIAMLFATAYMLSDFYARNELLAIFASGVPLIKFALPMLLVAGAMSFVLFVFEDKIVVPTYAKKTKLQDTVLNKEKSLNNEKIVIMAEGGDVIYKADFYDDKAKRLTRLFVLFRGEDKTLEAVILAKSATWSGRIWQLSGASEYKFTGDGLEAMSVERSFAARLTESPETFRNNTISVEEVNTREAREYIEHLEKAGLPSAEERSVYYKKYSFPSVVFIVVFLAIGLSGKTRKNVLLVSLGLSIAAVVLFYVMQMVTMLMAKFQAIPPVMGAWSPVVLFIFASLVLLHYAKT